MAKVSTGFTLSVTLIDSGGNTAVREYALTAADAAAAATASATIMAALDAVTDAEIKSYSIRETFIEDALVLPATAEVENLAEIVLQIDGNPLKKANISIPAPNAGIFVGAVGPNRNTVDPGDTALVTYATIWVTGQQATLSDGEVIELPVLSGKRVHRASRRG